MTRPAFLSPGLQYNPAHVRLEKGLLDCRRVLQRRARPRARVSRKAETPHSPPQVAAKSSAHAQAKYTGSLQKGRAGGLPFTASQCCPGKPLPRQKAGGKPKGKRREQASTQPPHAPCL